jgi:hypothetical protein
MSNSENKTIGHRIIIHSGHVSELFKLVPSLKRLSNVSDIFISVKYLAEFATTPEAVEIILGVLEKEVANILTSLLNPEFSVQRMRTSISRLSSDDMTTEDLETAKNVLSSFSSSFIGAYETVVGSFNCLALVDKKINAMEIDELEKGPKITEEASRSLLHLTSYYNEASSYFFKEGRDHIAVYDELRELIERKSSEG